MRAVGYRLYGVVGNAGILGNLRHPSMHPIHWLRHGLGLCAVRTEAVADEPLAETPGELAHLTTSVLGYVQEVSHLTPVVYVTADFAGGRGEQAACGWSEGVIVLGPLTSHHDCPPRPPRRFLRRSHETTGAIDTALRWLGIPGARRYDRFDAVGLGARRDWE